MKKKFDPDLDHYMMELLSVGKPMPLGIPAWMLIERTHRAEHPMDPKAALGLTDSKPLGFSLLGEYEDKVGYQFSWGTVSEWIYHPEDKKPGVSTLIFEISPEALLKRFPDPAIVEDIFIAEYEQHPNSGHYDVNEASGDNYTISLSVTGSEEDHELFRHWMEVCFLHEILPDLIKAAEKELVEVAEA